MSPALLLGFILVSSIHLCGAVLLSGCTTITVPGTYTLASDIVTSAYNCIQINSPDVMIDGLGYQMQCSTFGCYSAIITSERTTVANVVFTGGWQQAIRGNGNNNIISNCTFTGAPMWVGYSIHDGGYKGWQIMDNKFVDLRVINSGDYACVKVRGSHHIITRNLISNVSAPSGGFTNYVRGVSVEEMTCENVTISDLTINGLYTPTDPKDCQGAASINGITLFGKNHIVTNSRFYNLRAGDGMTCSTGSATWGGGLAAIAIVWSNDTVVENVEIANITSGNGGLGGRGGSNAAEGIAWTGGHRGVLRYSAISHVTGGAGGGSTGGTAGNGAHAWAIKAGQASIAIHDIKISYITGGNGGSDITGTSGRGGNAIGLMFQSQPGSLQNIGFTNFMAGLAGGLNSQNGQIIPVDDYTMGCPVTLTRSLTPMTSQICYPPSPGCCGCVSNSSCGCSAGTFYNTNLGVCTNCTKGTYRTAGMQRCEACAPGNYSTALGASSCLRCPAGKSTPGGNILCANCPLGTYSQQGFSQCLLCPPGTSAPAGSTTCKPCIAGTARCSGKTACIKCPVGQYAPTTGQAVCAPCPAGTYSNLQGATACKPCLAGQYSVQGKSSCSTCPPNTPYSPEGSHHVLSCSAFN